jgi:hypothetical protein
MRREFGRKISELSPDQLLLLHEMLRRFAADPRSAEMPADDAAKLAKATQEVEKKLNAT